jgi:antitoxin HicB
MIQYPAKIYKDGKRFSVEFPDLPGCFSEGKSFEAAKKNAREALTHYLEEARDPQWNVPRASRSLGKNMEWITPEEDVAIPLMIRQARLKHGLTQKELAQLLRISFQQVQKLETPGKSNPTVKTLALISRVLQERLEIKLVA